MGKIGISKETWSGTDSFSGYDICPVGHALHFEIQDVREGFEKNNPENEFATLDCVYTDDEGKKFHKWEYFRLSGDRLGWLKGFLERIGRCDMMDDEAEWEDIIGTQFTADVKHAKGKNGETYANFELSSIEAVNYEFFEPPMDDGEELEADDADLDETIAREAAKNESDSLQAKKALKEAKSTDAALKSSAKPVSKASPRRPRRPAGADR